MCVCLGFVGLSRQLRAVQSGKPGIKRDFQETSEACSRRSRERDGGCSLLANSR
jgi:hypothetical protein